MKSESHEIELDIDTPVDVPLPYELAALVKAAGDAHVGTDPLLDNDPWAGGLRTAAKDEPVSAVGEATKISEALISLRRNQPCGLH